MNFKNLINSPMSKKFTRRLRLTLLKINIKAKFAITFLVIVLPLLSINLYLLDSLLSKQNSARSDNIALADFEVQQNLKKENPVVEKSKAPVTNINDFENLSSTQKAQDISKEIEQNSQELKPEEKFNKDSLSDKILGIFTVNYAN